MVPEYGHHLTPPRKGAAALVYAVGDIHGSLRKLRALLARCERHAGRRPMTFVFLGDYIDRGPDSVGVIEAIMELQLRLKDQVIALMGNHEAVALEVIDGRTDADLWLREGGVATLDSYGVGSAGELPLEHVAWLRRLPLRYDDGQRLFVHAGIDPDRPLDAQRGRDLIWIREPFLSDTRDHGRLIVHGHTPRTTGLPDLRSNRLNLDTAAVFGGPLTAAAFDPARRDPIAFLQAD
jgi:serine/threonine protein phosphatase 1